MNSHIEMLARRRRAIYHSATCFHKKSKYRQTEHWMYRMHVYDDKTTGMHWHIHKHGARDYADAKTDSKIEVAVAIGADPSITYSATAPFLITSTR